MKDFCLRVTESQSDRVTELQKLKGTQYSGGWNFFMPDFNELPYSLRSQGDKKITIQIPTVHLSLSFTHTHTLFGFLSVAASIEAFTSKETLPLFGLYYLFLFQLWQYKYSPRAFQNCPYFSCNFTNIGIISFLLAKFFEIL